MSEDEKRRRASDVRIAQVLSYDDHQVPPAELSVTVPADKPAERESVASVLRHFCKLLDPADAFLERALAGMRPETAEWVGHLLVELRALKNNTGTAISHADALRARET